jgi:ABC-type dipeptide/oligopeptide/nickel transport system permease subunit
MDVLLAFPPILFLLVVATGAGQSLVALVIAIAIIHVPSIARVVRTAALETSVRGYVEAAVARGDRTRVILRREILPNIWGPVTADAGPRFTVSILLVAAVNFLGLGLSPPAADWAMMISENRSGITINPWAVIAPALLIAVLTVSVNVVADSIAHSLGKSVDVRALRR